MKETANSPAWKTARAEEEINTLVTSGLFQGSPLQRQKELAGQVLTRLEEDGLIARLSYDLAGAVFSFQYADATLGGVQLKRPAHPSELPMNGTLLYPESSP